MYEWMFEPDPEGTHGKPTETWYEYINFQKKEKPDLSETKAQPDPIFKDNWT